MNLYLFPTCIAILLCYACPTNMRAYIMKNFNVPQKAIAFINDSNEPRYIHTYIHDTNSSPYVLMK